MSVTFEDIQAAQSRIAGQVDRTPVRHSRRLSQATGAEVWVKFDNLHFTGSFKERGALNRLLSLTPDERRRGVVAASAGNHAQALAYHGGRLGIPVTIVMPEGTPFTKVDGTRSHGAHVVIHGLDFTASTAEAHRLRDTEGFVFISAFDDAGIVAGQGVCGLEFLEDAPDLDALVIPIGGGGLIAGCAIAAKAMKPDIRIFGVEAAMYPSLAPGGRACRPSAAGRRSPRASPSRPSATSPSPWPTPWSRTWSSAPRRTSSAPSRCSRPSKRPSPRGPVPGVWPPCWPNRSGSGG